jgi:lipoate-protein ligase B
LSTGADVKKSDLLPSSLRIENWGLLEYGEAFERQEQMVRAQLEDGGQDTLILVEHPPVVTLGRRGSDEDLLMPQAQFSTAGISFQRINRGGLATAHEPGQLVVYPVVALKRKDLRWFADSLLGIVVSLLADHGLQGTLKAGEPGVWVNDRKICSFGIAVKKWVSSHGIALNVNNDLNTFNMIVPCGRPEEQVTSMTRELGFSPDLVEIKQMFIQYFCSAFAYEPDA